MDQILDLQKLELDQMRIKLSESEKLMEERRLASEQQLEKIRLSMDAMQKQATSTAQQQPVVINNIIPKTKKRRASMINDELGNLSGIEMEDVLDEEG
jgi:hypothetical protein